MGEIWNLVMIFSILEICGEILENKFKQYYIISINIIIISLIFSSICMLKTEYGGISCIFGIGKMQMNLQNKDQKWIADESNRLTEKINNYYDEMENNGSKEGEKDE